MASPDGFPSWFSERQIQILESLEFTVDNKENDIFIVNPPSWRNDIDTENDVIEEITRIEGYDKIPYTDLIEKLGQNLEIEI